jgi:hypothetical protein
MLGNGFLPMFAQGGVALPAWAGATWAVSGGNAYNVPTLGSELLTNGGFESSFSAGLGIGWNRVGTPVTTQETSLVRSGANSQKSATVTNGHGVYEYPTIASGQWYVGQIFAYAETGQLRLLFATNGGATVVSSTSISGAGWKGASITGRTIGITSGVYIFQDGATPATFYVDDCSLQVITPSTLFATIAGASSNQTAAAKIATLTTGTQSGVVALLDSASNPQNFLNAYHNGTSVLLDKCVAGTYTNLITTTVAFTANAQIEIRRPSGNTFQLWYNGTQRGTNQTVSDAGIINNTRYGLFSTYSGGTFSEFSLGGVVIPFNLPGA